MCKTPGKHYASRVNHQLLVVLSLLGVYVALFIANRPRMDVVALIALVALPLTGVLTVSEALAGFSDPSVVLIGALFVVGEGLVRTGIATASVISCSIARAEARRGCLCCLCSRFRCSAR